MRYILCGINAKYIHSNLAIYSLLRYAKDVAGCKDEIKIKEYTINHYVDQILQDLYMEKADVIAFSCYIWNIDYVKELALELKKVAPHIRIWAGGPEVSYDADRFLMENPAFELVMQGEGEAVFSLLVKNPDQFGDIPGIAYRLPGTRELAENNQKEARIRELTGNSQEEARPSEIMGNSREKAKIVNHGFAPLMDMDALPFVYQDYELFRNKILYYETSRGCPFRCSYCLSSVDKTVRLRSLSLVYEELQSFLDAKVPQVKFIDRTFNCNKKHAMAIWKYILDHDNGITNFHFEISSDLLDDDALELFAAMRPGLIQLEIGVQSTNPKTIQAIDRHMDLKRLFAYVDRVHALGNIHQHLDLIVGLPYESYEQFAKSFDDLYVHAPDQLQVGFLKVLKGTVMEEEARGYKIAWREHAPYEVLKTDWLSYEEVIALKGIEALVELYYNSMQYTYTLRYALAQTGLSPFVFYETFARYYREKGYQEQNHNRMQKYEILRGFLLEHYEEHLPHLDDIMLYDMYLRENVKARPKWARDLSSYRNTFKEMYRKNTNVWFAGSSMDSKQAANMSHIEVFGIDLSEFAARGRLVQGETLLLFDYTKRNPLNKDARSLVIYE